MRDQARGGGEDRGGGAVVRLQPDDAGAGEVFLEAQDVFHFRATPAINRLIVVAYATNIVMALGQQAQPEILHQVGVLVFVHQDVAELAVVLRQHLGWLAQDLRHVQQQVAEIHRVQGAQPRLVGGI